MANKVLNYDNDCLVIVGKKGIVDIIGNSQLSPRIVKVLITSSQVYLRKVFDNINVNYQLVNKGFFEKKFRHLNHQYCALYLKAQKQMTLGQLLDKVDKEDNSLILILESINDPYNFGAILRTCASASVSGVIVLNKNQTPVNTTVLKASQGTCLLVPIVSVSNIKTTVQILKKKGFWVYGGVISKDTQSYDCVSYDRKCALIVGNEGKGISYLTQKHIDFPIMIPMNKDVNSLNVSVACGIMVYQIKSSWKQLH